MAWNRKAVEKPFPALGQSGSLSGKETGAVLDESGFLLVAIVTPGFAMFYPIYIGKTADDINFVLGHTHTHTRGNPSLIPKLCLLTYIVREYVRLTSANSTFRSDNNWSFV